MPPHVAPDQVAKRWLPEAYYPAVARHFGQRLYGAHLFSPAMHRQIVGVPDYTPPAAYVGSPYALDFFGAGGVAIKWLRA